MLWLRERWGRVVEVELWEDREAREVLEEDDVLVGLGGEEGC